MTTAPPVPPQRILAGQKALVTGANSGIGRGVAIALGQAGADVIVNYVSGDEAAEAVVDEIRSAGSEALAVKADVSSESEVAAMFAEMMKRFGTIDILVNNAGLQRDSAFKDMTLAQWNTVLGVNLTGQFLCSRQAVRGVPAPGRRAGGVVRGGQDHLHELGASADSLGRACELRDLQGRHQAADGEHGSGIRAASHPRQRHRARRHPHADQHQRLEHARRPTTRLMTLVPYGRIGEPEDIARAAVWLASDHSDYVVGTTLFVDGGMTLYPGFATGG